ncbi:MAG: ABC transporter ATP-binding protein [Myxococcales bacterium]|nr:ABC transporter ATP-binding protein [Myxococcales bacterium]MCB9579444.1 ABC transporter ATP-binding protein [Polyangiaceae bacterium]
MALLELDSVTVSVSSRVLVRDVSLTVDAGELVALVGPSGSGKTELLRTIAGLRDADAGSIRFRGRAQGQEPLPEWRRHVTYVAQRAVLLDGSVEDNLLRPFRYRHVSAESNREELTALAQRLGLGAGILGQAARTLSVGEQQRVGLLRALAIRPEVVLLDEPTSALDADAVSRVEAWLRERAAEGLAAVIVTHDAEQAERLTVRRVQMRDYAEPNA